MTAGEVPPDAMADVRRAIETKRWEDARTACRQLVAADPDAYPAWICLGAIESEKGDFDAASRAFERAAVLKSCEALPWRGLGDALHRLGRYQEAERAYAAATVAQPRDPYLYFQRGIVLAALRRDAEARESYERALALRPSAPDVLVNLGNLDLAAGRPEDALARYAKAEALARDMPEAPLNRGNALRALGRLDEACAAFERSLALRPEFVPALVNLGSTLRKLGRAEAAASAFRDVLAINPAHPDALNNLGVVYLDLENAKAALAVFDGAIAARPDHREALRNRAALRIRLNRHAEALEDCDRALALEPTRAEVHLNRAVALHALQRLEDALDAADRSIALRGDVAEAFSNRALTLAALGRSELAVRDLKRALSLRPGFAGAWNNLGHILQESGRLDEAIEAYARAQTEESDLAYIGGNLAHARALNSTWATFDLDRRDNIRRTRRGGRGLPPFASLSLAVSSRTQAAAARTWRDSEIAPSAAPLPARPRKDGRKWRIAYLSADFRAHAMSSLMIDVFRNHDRSRFEVAAFSLSRAPADALSSALAPHFDAFVDVSGFSDAQVVGAVRDWGPDVAIDLMGLTRDSRPNIFALRVAPVQAAFLGFPGPIGCDFIDYTIADAIVVPPHDRRAFAEAIAFLPHSYYPTSYRAQAPAEFKAASRSEYGLPEDAFIFVCFNNSYKFNPAVFDAWMRILKRAEQSVLWLLLDSEAARDRLRGRARMRGVDPKRLHFVARAPWETHLRRLSVADLFLDTWPYNAHTTAADALWAGVPVLTKRGRAFAGRVAASLLTAVGAPDLIADDLRAYERRAVELASDPKTCAALRAHLATARATAPLFDSARFAGDLEAAYEAMAERRLAGLPADDIRIPARRGGESPQTAR